MPRANRSYVPGFIWHITHRCHNREFLLRSATDRDNWRRWLWTARSRYGLNVLNFVVTSNHVHLLVFDDVGKSAVSRGMQLVQGATAQAFNRRRGRRGAFWQDRHHAVAVDTHEYLWRCLVYIDLNMVRAGVVAHPRAWKNGGYNEIQRPRARYRVLDLERLAALCGCADVGQLQRVHREHVETALRTTDYTRNPDWTDAIAIGRPAFVDAVRAQLGLSRRQRIDHGADEYDVLRECEARYDSKTSRQVPL